MYRRWTQTDYLNKHYNLIEKSLQHVQRMDTNRLPNQVLPYKPKVATTCAEDGHKQTTKTSTTIQTKCGYNMCRGWTQTDFRNKHYNLNQNCLQHVQRMDTNRLPKQALKYKPKVATTCTEDGHKQTTKTSTKI